MATHPPRVNPADALPELCAVLVALGYAIRERSAEGLYKVFATHPENLPVFVDLFSASAEVSCLWPYTPKGKESRLHAPGQLAELMNELNTLCRLVTCVAAPECMEVRACFPFALERGLFWAFMEAWMEDGRDLLVEVTRLNPACFRRETLH
jgi:hypothetical protein